ncbi:hypothetical protein [Luteimonas mephitis]|jgi:hypothetical protein|uniref:hypothetical protein n=1 Tax=Luteimonas mephitis TaxID=83615 RepID=UPI000429841E|nr:hypothetical protein [Luteimonas mephitis]
MSQKSTKAAIPPTSTSHLFARQSKAKDLSRSMTSETIANDLAAFRKQGGRVEVLGVTPLRMQVNVSTSRSRSSTSKSKTGAVPTARPSRKTASAATTGKVAAARR